MEVKLDERCERAVGAGQAWAVATPAPVQALNALALMCTGLECWPAELFGKRA